MRNEKITVTNVMFTIVKTVSKKKQNLGLTERFEKRLEPCLWRTVKV